MCLAQGPQRSDAGEALTRCPLVSSQALYHWATALPNGSLEHPKFMLKLMGKKIFTILRSIFLLWYNFFDSIGQGLKPLRKQYNDVRKLIELRSRMWNDSFRNYKKKWEPLVNARTNIQLSSLPWILQWVRFKTGLTFAFKMLPADFFQNQLFQKIISG